MRVKSDFSMCDDNCRGAVTKNGEEKKNAPERLLEQAAKPGRPVDRRRLQLSMALGFPQ